MEKELDYYLLKKVRAKVASRYVPNNSKILDLGCGDGFFIDYIKAKIKKAWGIDRKLPRGHAKPKKEVKIIDGDIEKLDLYKALKEKVDCVTLLAVIEHLNNPSILLLRIKKVLRKKGRLIITTPTPKSERILTLLAKFGLINNDKFKEHKTYFNEEKLKFLLKKTGYTKINTKKFELGFNMIATAENG